MVWNILCIIEEMNGMIMIVSMMLVVSMLVLNG